MCYRCVVIKETLEFVPPQLWPPNSPDLNSVNNNVWEIVQEMVYKTDITDLELSTTPQWQRDPAWPIPFSVTVLVRPDQWCVYCTPSLAIVPTFRNQLLSNLANLGGGPQLRWDNFWSFFSDNSVVARVRWAFQFLQGSVETFFRWSGKRLHNFAGNLLRKRHIKFHQSPNFVEDITENILISLFMDTLYIIMCEVKISSKRSGFSVQPVYKIENVIFYQRGTWLISFECGMWRQWSPGCTYEVLLGGFEVRTFEWLVRDFGIPSNGHGRRMVVGRIDAVVGVTRVWLTLAGALALGRQSTITFNCSITDLVNDEPSYILGWCSETFWVVEGDPFYLKFWVNRLRWSEIADFQSIFARSASAVARSKIVQLTLIGNWQRAFQWTEDEHCTLPLSLPKGGSNTQKGRTPSKVALCLKTVCNIVSLCENCRRQSCRAFIGLSIRAKMIGGDASFYMTIRRILTHPFAQHQLSISFACSASAITPRKKFN